MAGGYIVQPLYVDRINFFYDDVLINNNNKKEELQGQKLPLMFTDVKKNPHNAVIALCSLMEKHSIKDEVKAQVHKQQQAAASLNALCLAQILISRKLHIYFMLDEWTGM